MLHPAHRVVCALLTVAGATLAQTATPAPTPTVLIETVGPDGWRVRLGPTNLGSMLESERGRALWQPGTAMLFAGWQQLLGGDAAAFAASRQRWLDYAGSVRLAIWHQPERPNGNETWLAGLVFGGDGRTDLDALAGDLRRALDHNQPSAEWSERDLAGTTVSVGTAGDESVAGPIRDGDRVLLAYADTGDVAEAVQRIRAVAASLPEKTPPVAPALAVRVDVAAIVDAHFAAEGNRSERDGMQAAGFLSLADATLQIATAGPHVMIEVAQTFRSDDRGVFAALFPAASSIATTAKFAPTTAGAWKAGRFDARAFYETIEHVIATMQEQEPAKVRAEAKEELGIDPVDDLFAHLTDEVILITSPIEDYDELESTGWSLAFRLRDAAAFERGLLAAIEKAKPFLNRAETEQHGDVALYRYGSMFAHDLWLAVGHGVFAIGGGGSGKDMLVGMLDRAKAVAATPADDAAAAKLPAGFEHVQRHLPKGCTGVAFGDIASVAAMPGDLWLDVLDELLPRRVLAPLRGAPADDASDGASGEAFAALLREHHLDAARSASGYAARRWAWRLFW
jgi:hypothetical protein